MKEFLGGALVGAVLVGIAAHYNGRKQGQREGVIVGFAVNDMIHADKAREAAKAKAA